MPIYAIPGESKQTFCSPGKEPTGAILMSAARPVGSLYIAQVDGNWSEDITGIATHKRKVIKALMQTASYNISLHEANIPSAVATKEDWAAFLSALCAIHESSNVNVFTANIPTQPS